MRRVLKDKIGLLLCFLVIAVVGACNDPEGEHGSAEATKYTCPMHPQIVSDKPGSCPICNMDLVPLKREAKEAKRDVSLNHLLRPANELVVSDIRTVKPAEGVRAKSSSIRGVINYNTNNWRSVSARVGGRIEKLYVNYNYQWVNKGQRLFDIYSPDLANAQQELAYLRGKSEKNLLEAAKTKLRVLGASEGQINEVLRTGKVSYTVAVYSPFSGYLTERRVSATASTPGSADATIISDEGGGAGMSNMGASTSPSQGQVPQVASSAPLQIREGQYVSQGQQVFELINSSSVWAEFFVSQDQLKLLKKGQRVQVEALDNPEQKQISRISLIQPYYSEGSNFPLVRVRVENPAQRWKIGQLLNMSTEGETFFGNWLPRTSILQTGSRHVVFVKKGRSFEPEYVTIKQKAGDWIDIGNSLAANKEVAVNAWFMVDSESFVKVDSI